MRDVKGRGARSAAIFISTMVSGSFGVGANAFAQEAATPAELPPLEVTAQGKKKAAATKKKPATSPVPQAAPPAVVESADTEQAGEVDGSLSSNGGVDGYIATRSSTATKTNTRILDIPQSITVVTQQQAKDQGSRDLNKALTYVPGIVMGQGEGHRDAPTIRGVSTTADFFIDGVRDDVQYFRDLYNIDRVEVLKGPNAMIFGRGGGGGVINRVTKKADGERLYEATTTYGSFDTKRVEIDAGQAVTHDFAVRINGMYEDSGSYRDFVDLERYGINPKITFRPSEDTRVRLAYEYFSEDRTVDRGIPSNSVTGKPAKTHVSTFFGNPDESDMDFRGHTATATIEHKFDNGIEIKNHTLYGNYEKFYQNVFANSAWNGTPGGTIALGAYNQITDRETIFNQTDVTTKINMGSGIRHTLLGGVEVGYQETDNQRDPTSGNYPMTPVPFSNPVSWQVPAWGTNLGPVNHSELNLAGVYVQDQIEITRYFDVIGGIRFDRFDLDYTNETTGAGFSRVDDVWSPRVGVVFKPIETLSFYASYSKSFLPQSGEQFATLTAVTENFKPEEFENKEIGFKWEVAARLLLTGAIFQLDRKNQSVAITPSVNEIIGESRTEGGELALTGYLTDAWEVVAGYGYQDAEIVQGPLTTPTNGNTIALVPRHTFSLWNKYQFLPNWAAGLGVISRSDMYANVDNRVILPGFARVDAALFWDISEDFKAQLNVENVFDIDYYSTSHSNNNITPGSPRAAYFTLTSRF
jgi:catecholate siderophore receptor